MKYLALGDSYTVGEAVKENESWPVLLVEKLKSDSIIFNDPEVIATTGWTTDELIKGIDKKSLDTPYDMVSLLIGVNNQYRGYSISQYEEEFTQLLERSISYAGNNTSKVFVVSIPDYGVTPFVKEKKLDENKIFVEINQYNQMAKSICISEGVDFLDITPESRKAKSNLQLIATDGLHPSGPMYASWVEIIYSRIKSKF